MRKIAWERHGDHLVCQWAEMTVKVIKVAGDDPLRDELQWRALTAGGWTTLAATEDAYAVFYDDDLFGLYAKLSNAKTTAVINARGQYLLRYQKHSGTYNGLVWEADADLLSDAAVVSCTLTNRPLRSHKSPSEPVTGNYTVTRSKNLSGKWSFDSTFDGNPVLTEVVAETLSEAEIKSLMMRMMDPALDHFTAKFDAAPDAWQLVPAHVLDPVNPLDREATAAPAAVAQETPAKIHPRDAAPEREPAPRVDKPFNGGTMTVTIDLPTTADRKYASDMLDAIRDRVGVYGHVVGAKFRPHTEEVDL